MIEFKNVTKIYDNGVKALSNVDLTIEQGEFVAIIGLSGSGKSTLIRCVNRMHEITSGELYVNNVNVSNLKGKEVRNFRRDIGMVFQSFNLVTRSTVINNVMTAFVPELSGVRKFFGVFTKENKIDALTALDNVNILDKAYTRVDQLSGGQMQRVALARVLAQDPKVILADEPVASLDPITSVRVMDDFKRINEDKNISVLINIHDVEMAIEYADRIIGINKGNIIFDGKSSEVTEEVLDKIYEQDFEKNENEGE
ncbi:MAG TPA: phosphonate ABC transporter ATP-binding protein [Tissierellaceae bacterium]|nr:phosphonate ABC transporter ATP-binding protein [Tissierellaceae bacterium]